MSCSKIDSSHSPGEEGERSCAFCLIPISGGKVLRCAKCHRRAYCSKECQVADWSDGRRKGGPPASSPTATGFGQSHKNWCSIPCGEEGLDWAIREVPGKGRGLVALRDLPPLYRIIVEGYQTLDQPGLESHPGFIFLRDVPEGRKNDSCGESPSSEGRKKSRKFLLNAVGIEQGSVLGFRISLGNHACDSNAAFTDDDSYKVLILVSLKPIKAGEEICYQYDRFNDIRRPLSDPVMRCLTMKMKWGFDCPGDCVCKDPALRSKLSEMQRLNTSFETLCQRGQFDLSLRMMKNLLNLAESVAIPVNVMSAIHFWAFQLHCARRKTVSKGMPYIRKVIEFSEAVYHPKSYKEVGRYREMEESPSRVLGYGGGD